MAIKSPFPGMDPYLERHWGDIHHSLVQYARDHLQGQLPDTLRARVEERIFLESDEGWKRNVFPDVRIVDRGRRKSGMRPPALQEAQSDGGGLAVAEPLVVIVPQEHTTEGFIEIRDGANGNRVVTVIEILSPANKAGAAGTGEYLAKQRQVLAGDINLVEIDLLRRGRRITALPIELLPASHRQLYHVCVKRFWRLNEYEFYRIPLRERLPSIRVPLRETDADVRLDLQALIDQAYTSGRYDDIDYQLNPDPPLDEDDAKWADELLRSQKLRA